VLWGFAVVLALVLLWWPWQYRTTRQKAGIYPVDSWSGYTSELAARPPRFFILLSVILVGFAIALIVGTSRTGRSSDGRRAALRLLLDDERARVPAGEWPYVYASLQAHKPTCRSTRLPAA